MLDTLQGLSWQQAMLKLFYIGSDDECISYNFQLSYSPCDRKLALLKSCKVYCCYEKCPWEIVLAFSHPLIKESAIKPQAVGAKCIESTIGSVSAHSHDVPCRLVVKEGSKPFFRDFLFASKSMLPDLQIHWRPFGESELCEHLSSSFRFWLNENITVIADNETCSTLEYAMKILSQPSTFSAFPLDCLPKIFPCLFKSRFALRELDIKFHIQWHPMEPPGESCNVCNLASKIPRITDPSRYCEWHYDMYLLELQSRTFAVTCPDVVFNYVQHCLLRDATNISHVDCSKVREETNFSSLLDTALSAIGIPALYDKVLRDARASPSWDTSENAKQRAAILIESYKTIKRFYPIMNHALYLSELKKFIYRSEIVSLIRGDEFRGDQELWDFLDEECKPPSEALHHFAIVELPHDRLLLHRLGYTVAHTVASGIELSADEYRALLPSSLRDVIPESFMKFTEHDPTYVLHEFFSNIVRRFFKLSTSPAYEYAPPKRRKLAESLFSRRIDVAKGPEGYKTFPPNMKSTEKRDYVKSQAALAILNKRFPLRIITLTKSEINFPEQLKQALSQMGMKDSSPVVMRGMIDSYASIKFSSQLHFQRDRTRYDKWYTINASGFHESELKTAKTGSLSDFKQAGNALVAIDGFIPNYLPLMPDTVLSCLPESWLEMTDGKGKQFFLATSTSFGPLHYDSLGVVYLCLEGRREITFCHPTVSAAFQKKEEHIIQTTNPYLQQTAFSLTIPHLKVTLEPGDMCIFEKGVFHCVRGDPDPITGITAACNWVYNCPSLHEEFRTISRKMFDNNDLATFVSALLTAELNELEDPQGFIKRAIDRIAHIDPWMYSNK